MGHHLDSDDRFQSDKHDLPPDRVRLSLEVPENWPGLLLIAEAYLAIDREFGEDLRYRIETLQAKERALEEIRFAGAVKTAYEASGDECEHANCRVDATSVMVADEGPRHGKRHLAIRARCEDCRRLFVFGDVLEKAEDGTIINIAMAAGPLDPTPQCASCTKDMPGIIASNVPVYCAACIAEARSIKTRQPDVKPPPPSGKVINYSRGKMRPMGTATTVHPGAAIFAFMGWLTIRDERSGPFSNTDDAATAADLAGAYVVAQGWKGDDMTSSRKYLVPGPFFTIHRCGNEGECVGCHDCSSKPTLEELEEILNSEEEPPIKFLPNGELRT